MNFAGFSSNAADKVGDLMSQAAKFFKKVKNPEPPKATGTPGVGGGSQEEVSKHYGTQLEQQRLATAQTGGQLTEQLRQQAMGEGPLANAQLKQAQTRNLAQTLAAAQGAGGSPLAMRQMLQQRGQQGQELAEAGIKERMGAQQALGAQLAQQAGIGRADIMAGFDISKAPAVMAQERELQRAQIQAQKDAAFKQQQSQTLGGLIGGVATLLSDENAKEAPEDSEEEKKSKERRKRFADAASAIGKGMSIDEGLIKLGGAIGDYIHKPVAAPAMASAAMPVGGMRVMSPDILSDVEQKVAQRNKGKDESKLPSAAKEVNEMMDKLEPKKYRYKNPNAPGAAEGNRYGIVAQDLEKSSLGKTLVKQTQQGKMVDTVQGFGAVLAAQAELNRRLKKLEKKGK